MSTINLTAERLNVRMYQGDTFEHEFDANFDLSNTEITAILLDETKQKVADLVVTDPVESQEETGLWEFKISLEDTSKAGIYTWHVVFEGDNTRTNIVGSFTIIERGNNEN